MKLILTLGLTLVLATLTVANVPCHTSELMACVDIYVDWFHTLPKRSLPVTEDELTGECEAVDKAMNCAFKFRDNCMTPLQKEVLSLLIEGALDFTKEYCNPSSAMHQKYLANAPCLNKLSQSDEVKALIEYALAVVENFNKQAKSDAIMYACCGYRKVRGTMFKMSTQTCGKEAVDPVVEMMRKITAQLPDVVCNGIDGTEEKCVGLLPPEGAKVSADAQKTELFKFLHHVLKNWLD